MVVAQHVPDPGNFGAWNFQVPCFQLIRQTAAGLGDEIPRSISQRLRISVSKASSGAVSASAQPSKHLQCVGLDFLP
jgi:hypothetical protein